MLRLKKLSWTTGIVTLVFLLLSLSSCTRRAEDSCWIFFQAAVHQGPDAGMALAGDLDLVFSGESRFEGVLRGENGRTYAITGQFDGMAVNWILDLGSQNLLFGVGASQRDLSACQGRGGGTFSGPQPGDSGDWSWRFSPPGESIVTTAWPQIVLVLIVMGLLLLAVLILLSRLFARMTPSRTTPSSARKVPPETWPDEVGRPLAQFLSTYTFGDDRYDISFAIEDGEEYLGECGVGITETLGAAKPKKVQALEVWLFDKHDINTTNGFLVGEPALSYVALQGKQVRKDALVAARPGEEIRLETAMLRLRARVVDVAYGDEANRPRSYFARLTLKLGVWKN